MYSPQGTPEYPEVSKTTFHPYSIRLRCRIRIRPSENVRVAECGRANDVGCGSWHRSASLQGHAPGVDGRAVRSVAHVVPDGGTIRSRGYGIDVVPQELGDQTVRARASRIARRAAVQYSPSRWCPSRSDVRMKNDTFQNTRRRGIGAVRGEERIIDHVE